VRPLLVLIACCGVGLGARPALAFKNVEGCDIVAFASPASPIEISNARWQAYRESAEAVLSAAPGEDTMQGWRAVADKLIEVQMSLLEPVKASRAYQDYVAGESCLVLGRLDASAVEGLLDEVDGSAPEPQAAALRQVTRAARAQIDNIERSARFRSARDRTLFKAGYYCFVAAAIHALLPPERREATELGAFGQTVTCREAGRTQG
jgi:hypothetical protein